MICCLQDTNKFLSYRTLCTSILKCGFPTKYQSNTIRRVTWSGSALRNLGPDLFGFCGIQGKLWSKKF